MNNPKFAPEAVILSNGSPLEAQLRASISAVSLQQGLEGADRLELSIADGALRFLEHPQLALDRELRLRLGYAPDGLEQVFVGDVVGLTPHFPADGSPQLTVIAHDRRARLQRGDKTRWFAIAIPCVGPTPIPDPPIAAAVAAEHALQVASDLVSLAIAAALGGIEYGVQMIWGSGAQDLVRKQRSESDYAFLARIADENGWMMTIDHSGANGGNVLRFSSMLSHLVPDLRFRYGENLIDFAPRLTTVGEILAVSARFWIPEQKLQMSVTVSWNWDRQALEVKAVPSMGMSADDGGSNVNSATTLLDQDVSAKTASRAILAKLIDKLNQRLTGSATTTGDTRLRPGVVVQIDGVGRLFGGPYRVTGVRHSLDSGGFHTSFDVRKEVWFDGAQLMRGAQGALSALSPFAALDSNRLGAAS